MNSVAGTARCQTTGVPGTGTYRSSLSTELDTTSVPGRGYEGESVVRSTDSALYLVRREDKDTFFFFWVVRFVSRLQLSMVVGTQINRTNGRVENEEKPKAPCSFAHTYTQHDTHRHTRFSAESKHLSPSLFSPPH